MLFFATLWRRTWQLPVIGFGLMVLSAILIGGLYPAIVQKFQVQPNEQAKEAPYVDEEPQGDARGVRHRRHQGQRVRGHAATPRTRPSCATTSTPRRASASLDPNIVSPTFQQLQQMRNYYAFPTNLDVDRYSKDGKDQDTVIGLRELNLNGIPKNNWINDHFRYTHGYGVVAAKGTTADAEGRPVFTESDLPSKGDLGTYQQRIYYGEKTSQYSIVGGPQKEIDYSDDNGEKTTSYKGDERGQPLQPGQPRRVRGGVQRAADPLLRCDRRGFADPVQPHAQGARRGGRALADHRRRRLPGGRRRQDPVDRRRVHDDERLPVRLPHHPGRHDGRLADRRQQPARGGGPAEPGQLHPQLGEGDRRRVHRRGQALPVGHQGPGPEDLDEGVPGHGGAEERHLRPR